LVALSAEPATAHVNVSPSLVQQGVVTDVHVELPQLRPGGPPNGLELAGDQVEVLATREQGKRGSESVWTVRLRANAAPGNVPIVLRARYPDGSSVEVDAALTVVPGPEEAGFPWAGVIVGAGLAAGFAAVALVVARRKA
jgi:hypothetical protein